MRQLFLIVAICCFTLQITSCKQDVGNKSGSVNSSSSLFSVTKSEVAKNYSDDLLDSDFELCKYDGSIRFRIGDSMPEIENKVGVTLSKPESASTVKHQGIILCIRKDEYAGGFIIESTNEGQLVFKTTRDIKLGTTLGQVKSVYGEPTKIVTGEFIFYVYKKEEDKYKLLKKEEATGNVKPYYFLQFNINSENVVTKITAGDFSFVYNRK